MSPFVCWKKHYVPLCLFPPLFVLFVVFVQEKKRYVPLCFVVFVQEKKRYVPLCLSAKRKSAMSPFVCPLCPPLFVLCPPLFVLVPLSLSEGT